MLSGGADSMALLELVRLVGQRLGLGLSLEALHVDYARRGADSARDRAIVANACEAAGLRMHLLEPGRPPRGENFQAWAREARYQAAERIAQERRLDLIAVAHSRDDQAETVLYRLAKYGGPAGVAGMPVRDGRLVRPLLCLGAAEIRAYCRRRGIAYGDDVSNAQPVYARNRLRLRVLPELAHINPRVVETLADTAELAALERDIVAAAVDGAWRRVLVASEPPAIDVRRLADEPPALRALCVSRLLAGTLGGEALIERRLVAAVEHLARDGSGTARAALPGGWEAVREYERLTVRRRTTPHVCPPLALAPPGGWRPGACLDVEFCERRLRLTLEPGPALVHDVRHACVGLARLPARVLLRHARPGERFTPLGAAQSRGVARLLMAAKVPRDERCCALVVDVDGELAWIASRRSAGDAFAVARVAQSFAVTESTTLTLTVTEEGT